MSETKVFRFPGMVVNVHRPELTEEERTKRMEAIHKQAENLLRSVSA
jgi:ribosome recycling factor